MEEFDLESWLKKKHHLLFIGGGIFLFLFILAAIGNMLPSTQIEKDTINYELLNKETLRTVQNIDVIVSLLNDSEKDITKIVSFIQKEECDKPCNIMIYDVIDAFQYQQEYDTIMSSSLSSEEIKKKIQEWDKEYYVFVAQHLIAIKSFDTETIWMYPFKDSRYQELIYN